MFNKKRLVMMAVATSMVLPTNLTYLSMATSVLATDTTPDNEEENTIPSENDPIEITTTSISNGSLNLEDGKSYKLKKGIVLNLTNQITIPTKAQITLDLNGGTINSSAQNVFLLKEGAFLEVIGSGSTIQSTYPGSVGQIFASCEPDIQLNIGNGITLTASAATDFIYGIGLDSKRNGTSATGAVINVTGVTMTNIQGGIAVNGNMPEVEDTAPLINLTNVIINATTTQSKANSQDPSDDSIGIYQAGYSVINVVDCTITSDRLGIETRDGVLNVSGGSISGSTEKHTRVDSNGNGSTTAYAGIAIDQHSNEPEAGYTRPISVNVTNVENITGYIPVVISNTNSSHQNDVEENEIDPDVSIILSNVKGWTPATEEDGTSLPKVGYTSEKIGFTLVDCGVEKADIKQYSVTAATDNSENNSFTLVDSQPENHPNATLINTEELGLNVTPTSTLTISTSALGTSQVNGNMLNETAISSVQDALAGTINDLDAQPAFLNPIDPETGEAAAEASGLGYKYTVEVTGAVIKKGDNYILPVALKAQLDKEKSVVRLIIPLNTEQTESAFVEEREVATGEWTNNQFPVDVELSKVLDNTGKIKSDTVKKMLTLIPALQGKYDTNADFEFATFNLNGTYSVADTTSPISFVGTKKATNTGGTGGSHKPKPKPEEPIEPVVSTPTTMYRLYNRLTGEHLYTIDKNERDNLLTSDTWKDEGEGWIAPSVSDYPVYRLLNPNNSDHHYTMDKNEFDTLPSYGWIAEGVAFFSADKENPENVLLHRLYNPNAEGAGSHHYTADTNERDTLVAQGWKYEGLAWAGLPANK